MWSWDLMFIYQLNITLYSSWKGAPGVPRILTNTRNNDYEKETRISWKRPKYDKSTPIFYYTRRYKKLDGDGSWATIETLGNEERTTYSVVLRNLEWSQEYLVELYAGNSNGVGKAAVRNIRKPRGKLRFCNMNYFLKIGTHGVFSHDVTGAILVLRNN